MNDRVTAQEWFSSGTRIPYDPVSKKVLSSAESTVAADAIQVFERVERGDEGQDDQKVWTTFLPGFPDGSFGWARVDRHLSGNGMVPKLHVEYVGQGDSDKPSKYPYGTIEPNQVVKARERLGDHGLDIRMLPGGHMTTSEQPEQFARIIEEVGPLKLNKRVPE